MKGHIVLLLFFLSACTALAQWSLVDSGTTTNLNGVYLLDSGVGYAVGDAGTIQKTIDGGMTWSALVSGTTRALYDVYFFDDVEGVTVGERGLILRTTDGGATWQTITSGVRDDLHAVSFSGTSGICGGLSQDILYSTDSGATWHVSQRGFFGGGFFGAQMLSPTLGFVSGQNSIFQGLLGTTVDGGASWSFQFFYFNNTEGSADDLFFFDSSTGVTSGVLFDETGAIARTANSGHDWNSTIFSQGMQGIDFPRPESGFAVGFGGRILNSIDMGTTWSQQTSGTSLDLFDVHFASDGLTGLAVGEAGIILRTTDGGQTRIELLAAASRLTHGNAGTFDINMPLSGMRGVEARSSDTYNAVFTFDAAVTSGEVTVLTGTATVGAITFNGNEMTAALTGVTDIQTIVLHTENINGDGQPHGDVPFSFLVGDIDGDGSVGIPDKNSLAANKGQPVTGANFRNDINPNGRIGAGDKDLLLLNKNHHL